MSYEGYEQHICKNGHYFEVDANEALIGEEARCFTCKETSAWHNPVDETNYEQNGKIPYEVLHEKYLKEPDICKCDKCGDQHLKTAIFNIPPAEETVPLRTITVGGIMTPLVK
jgi:hypothetical protein